MEISYYQTLNMAIQSFDSFLWGWPLIIFFLGVGAFATVYLGFPQFVYFFRSWQLLFRPSEKGAHGQMTPFQAFLNALNASVGNGSLAGMAVAINLGGPGAAFWMLIFGAVSLIIRFCEVYLSSIFHTTVGQDGVLGGPMVYLRKAYGGKILPGLYALLCLLMSLISGCAMQCNSVTIAIQSITPINNAIIGLFLFAFVIYVILGGAQRIIKISQVIVPVKVGGFFITAIILLGYHAGSILEGFRTITTYAFGLQPMLAGAMGYSIIHSIKYAISLPLNATEAGLGTAGILFGSTGSKNAAQDSIMAMASTFISNYLVCFMLAFIFVISGAWQTGLTSTALTTAAYQTAFGQFGGVIVSSLSILFGMGVIVTYGFIGRECWAYLTGGKFLGAYGVVYCLMALFGSVMKVDIIWSAINVINAGLLAINLYGIACLLPKIKESLNQYKLGKNG